MHDVVIEVKYIVPQSTRTEKCVSEADGYTITMQFPIFIYVSYGEIKQ